MSRRGNCWDNAVAESFFSFLKKERIRKRIYKTRDLARADVFDYIEVFYNRTRRHSHLGGVSPEAFERASNWGLSLSTVVWEVQSDHAMIIGTITGIYSQNNFGRTRFNAFQQQIHW